MRPPVEPRCRSAECVADVAQAFRGPRGSSVSPNKALKPAAPASSPARPTMSGERISDVVRREHGLPVTISTTMTPNAQMSARLSDGLAARLLRAHVRGCAENHPLPGRRPDRGND